MLYLKGTSKLHINQVIWHVAYKKKMIQRSQTAFEIDLETPVKHYRTLIMICLNIRITTMGQIAMASGMKVKAV